MCDEYLPDVQYDNISFKSESSCREKNFFSKKPSFFVFVSLLIATYFILNLIIEGTESNPASPYAGAHGIKKAVQGTFHQGYS